MSFKDKNQKKKLNKGKYKKDAKVVPISKHRSAGNHLGNKDEDGVYTKERYQDDSDDALATGLIVGLEVAAQIADNSDNTQFVEDDAPICDPGDDQFGGFGGGDSDGGGTSSDY